MTTAPPPPHPFRLHWAVQDESVTHNFAEDAKPAWITSTIRGFYWPSQLGDPPTLQDFLADPNGTINRYMQAAGLYGLSGYPALAHNDATELIPLRATPGDPITGKRRVRAMAAFHTLLRLRLFERWPNTQWALWGELMMAPWEMDSPASRLLAKIEIEKSAPALFAYDWLHPELYPQNADHDCAGLFAEILSNTKSVSFILGGRRIIPVIGTHYPPQQQPDGSFLPGGLVTPAHYRVFVEQCRAAGINEGALWGPVHDAASGAEAAGQAEVIRGAVMGASGGKAEVST